MRLFCRTITVIVALVARVSLSPLPTLAVSPPQGNALVLEVDVPGEVAQSVESEEQEEQPAARGTFAPFTRLASAIAVMIRFLLAPLNARVGPRCGENDDADDDDTGGGQPVSFSRRLLETLRNSAATVKRHLGRLTERLGSVFRNPAAWTARIVEMAKAFSVHDLPVRPGVPRQDNGRLFELDIARLNDTEDVKLGVTSVCLQAVKMYPEGGYNQGFDWACRGILLAVSSDVAATLQVYTKWAVPVTWLLWYDLGEDDQSIAKKAVAYVWSIIKDRAPTVFGWLSRDPVIGCSEDDDMVDTLLVTIFFEPLATFCTRLGLRKAVFRRLVEYTMEAGVHGPAVTIYVVLCVLCIAEKRSKGNYDESVLTEDTLQAAAQSVRSFAALESAAPVSLAEFVDGYRATITDVCTVREDAYASAASLPSA